MRIFISYSSSDEAKAKAIISRLKDNGCINSEEYWISCEHLTEDHMLAIPREIGKADAVLFFVSECSKDAPGQETEIKFAEKPGMRKPVIPFLLERVNPKGTWIQWPLTGYQCINGYEQGGFEKLLTRLSQIKKVETPDMLPELGDSGEDGLNVCGTNAYKDSILSEIIYEECAAIEPINDFSVGQGIADDKLSMAVKEWGIVEGTPVFALFDATWTGGNFGLDGFAITLKGVYIKEDNANPHYFAWEDIDPDEIGFSGDGIKISGYELTTWEDEESNSKMAIAIYKCVTRIAEIKM